VVKYRLCDYPAHAPFPGATIRCSPHVDYGSATLIFEDGEPGLQVWRAESETWQPVPPGARGDALLLFGWCTCVRSNGRVNALKHRVVVEEQPPGATPVAPRRVSLVLFAAPPPDARIDPVVASADEEVLFRNGVAGNWRTQSMRAHLLV
tara:strand:- start:105 stop:554 length:450 start_codon:yes stop_codon:yes gene_type:complete